MQWREQREAKNDVKEESESDQSSQSSDAITLKKDAWLNGVKERLESLLDPTDIYFQYGVFLAKDSDVTVEENKIKMINQLKRGERGFDTIDW